MSRSRRFLSGFAVAFGIGLAFLAGWVQLPYYSLGPGPAREVQPLISVSGHQEFPSQGS
jgi:PDZ domain-containing secreted protein